MSFWRHRSAAASSRPAPETPQPPAAPVWGHWFEKTFGRPHAFLTDADQLPDLDGDALNFTWDAFQTEGDARDPGRDDDEHGVIVLVHDGRIVWRELYAGHPTERWPAVIERLLAKRYGDRFAGLTAAPWRGSKQGSGRVPWDDSLPG